MEVNGEKANTNKSLCSPLTLPQLAPLSLVGVERETSVDSYSIEGSPRNTETHLLKQLYSAISFPYVLTVPKFVVPFSLT